MSEVLNFSNRDEAVKWARETFECMDNFRWAPLSKPEDMETYAKQRAKGCCGSYDEIVRGPEGLTLLGCNYGH